MKQIKPRVYDKKTKEYVSLEGVDYGKDGEVLWYRVDSCDEHCHHDPYLLAPEDAVVEAFTGLTDEKGKKIYEGDVVKARWHKSKNARFDAKGVVYFHWGWFGICCDPDGEDREDVPLHNCYEAEVICNVHDPNLKAFATKLYGDANMAYSWLTAMRRNEE